MDQLKKFKKVNDIQLAKVPKIEELKIVQPQLAEGGEGEKEEDS